MTSEDSPCDFSQYLGCVRSVLSPYASREHPVEDLVQETFVEAYQSTLARGPPRKPRQWILSIAYRTAVRGLRQKYRRGPVQRFDDAMDEQAVGPLDEAIARESHERLAAGLEKLSPCHEYILAEHYLQDISRRELSERMEISYDAVKVRLCRARLRLRWIVGKDMNPT